LQFNPTILVADDFKQTTGPAAAVPAIVLPEPSDVLPIVNLILDANALEQERSQAIEDNRDLAADLLVTIVSDIKPGTKQESSRLPWLWRIAVEAGKANDAEQIHRILDISLPDNDQSLDSWRAVVVGGGIVSGIASTNISPQARIQEIIADDQFLTERWQLCIRLASRVVDDKSVSVGSRYDALRIVAMDRWVNAQPTLERYLNSESEPEMQMAAVLGLVHAKVDPANELLLNSLDHLTEQNRALALDGMLQYDQQCEQLLDRCESRPAIARLLSPQHVKRLLQHPFYNVQTRAARLFAHN
jgi:hypothetical protein